MTSSARTSLESEVRLADPDRAYRMLIEAHRGLSDASSAALNARLILLLANEVGDLDRLAAVIALAKATAPTDPSGSGA